MNQFKIRKDDRDGYYWNNATGSWDDWDKATLFHRRQSENDYLFFKLKYC